MRTDIEVLKKKFPALRNATGEVVNWIETIPDIASEKFHENVYRLCLNGEINVEAFECTFESDKHINAIWTRPVTQQPSMYSTSIITNWSRVKKIKNVY